MTVRVYAVTPIHVDADELARRRARYAGLSPAGLTLHLDDIGPAAPRQLANAADVAASERAVDAALPAGEGWDFLLPDCVLDPGVPEVPGGRRTGILKLTTAHLMATGHRIGAVTRNAAIADELRRKTTAYGFGAAFTGVAVLDLSLADIADAGTWNQAVAGALDRLAAGGATAVINGCSAVDVDMALHPDIAVIDPTATALRLLAAGVSR
ncbi:MAG TPA: aspartate/glutamate racemase family protein [Pseudonocardiaceae bacterium]|nr:aspartate/glutamate racemase family protein [Pseudonocardiaceae bacterium]